MQHFAKQYFWLINVAVVVLCAYFTALAADNYVEATYLSESAKPPKLRALPVRKPHRAERRSKDGTPLVTRNMFCSTCEPPEPDSALPAPADGSMPETTLPLRLIATNIASREANSFATIRNTESGRQGAYWPEEVIPDAGKVEQVEHRQVIFFNDKTKRLERIALLDQGKPDREPTKPPPRRSSTGNRDDLRAAIDEGIKEVGTNSYEVDRDLVNKLMSNPMVAARGARIVPSIRNGKANGFKLYAIRPSSLYAKLGLKNGDTIQAVNGFDLTTPDKALEVYTKVKEASNLTVSITRRGKPVTIHYNVD